MSDLVPIKDIEESPGVVSMIRVLAKSANRTGQLMIAAGIVLSAGMLLRGSYELIPVATALIVGGPSLIGVAMGAKAWQAQAEGG